MFSSMIVNKLLLLWPFRHCNVWQIYAHCHCIKTCQIQPTGIANQTENKKNPCHVTSAKAKYMDQLSCSAVQAIDNFCHVLWLKNKRRVIRRVIGESYTWKFDFLFWGPQCANAHKTVWWHFKKKKSFGGLHSEYVNVL